MDLKEGSKVQFGASTRVFVFRSNYEGLPERPAPASTSGAPPRAARACNRLRYSETKTQGV